MKSVRFFLSVAMYFSELKYRGEEGEEERKKKKGKRKVRGGAAAGRRKKERKENEQVFFGFWVNFDQVR